MWKALAWGESSGVGEGSSMEGGGESGVLGL